MKHFIKWLRLGYSSVEQNITVYWVVVLQIACVLLGINVLIAGMNGRTRYYQTYEPLLEKQGYVIYMTPGMEELDFDTYVEWEQAEYEPLLEKLNGKATAKRFYTLATDEDFSYQILILDDELFERMDIPLQSGSYKDKAENQINAIASPDAAANVSANNQIYDATIHISGVLTNETYMPTWSKYSSDRTIMQYYQPYSSFSGDADSKPFIFVRESEAKEFFPENKLMLISRLFISYEEAVDSETLQQDNDLLQKYGTVISFFELKSNSLNYIRADLYKFGPILICILLISLTGLFMSIGISCSLQLRKNGIYCICGASSKDIFMIRLMEIGILLSCSGAFSLAGCMVACFNPSIANQFGLQFGWNNCIISVLLLIIVLFITALVPMMILRKNPPAKVLMKESA